jgi:hypothetical protein
MVFTNQFASTLTPKHGYIAESTGAYSPQTEQYLVDAFPVGKEQYSFLTAITPDTTKAVYSPYHYSVVATPKTAPFRGLTLGNATLIYGDGTPVGTKLITGYTRCVYFATFKATLNVGDIVTAGDIVDGVVTNLIEAGEGDAIYGVVLSANTAGNIGQVFYNISEGHGKLIPVS